MNSDIENQILWMCLLFGFTEGEKKDTFIKEVTKLVSMVKEAENVKTDKPNNQSENNDNN